jgi:hypothetical protein
VSKRDGCRLGARAPLEHQGCGYAVCYIQYSPGQQAKSALRGYYQESSVKLDKDLAPVWGVSHFVVTGSRLQRAGLKR